MERKRINGDEVWLYKAYPGPWQVHFIWPNGKGHLLAGTQEERPSYDRILDLLRRVPGSQASQSWIDRISATLRAPPPILLNASPPSGPQSLDAGSSSTPALAVATPPGGEGDERRRTRAESSTLGAETKGPKLSGARQGTEVELEGLGEEASLMLELGNGEAAWEADGEETGASRRIMDIDIITGQPVRDIRMEPVLQMARWQKAIFGNGNQGQG
eukprot:jgi/Botrbrau1/1259/Bobra.0163s0052.1